MTLNDFIEQKVEESEHVEPRNLHDFLRSALRECAEKTDEQAWIYPEEWSSFFKPGYADYVTYNNAMGTLERKKRAWLGTNDQKE